MKGINIVLHAEVGEMEGGLIVGVLPSFKGYATTEFAPTLKQLRERLKVKAIDALDDYVDFQSKGYRRRYLGCTDGTVLRVHWSHGSWGYEIAGPDRKHTSSVAGPEKTFDEAVARARGHAHQCYGGVSWEC